jgi:hypothetical protein
MPLVIWFGIAFCVTQSAMFSGLNLAFFSLSRLRLEVEVAGGNRAAEKVLRMRRDSNFLLTTILWGNVGINVLLTLLADSVLAGVGAFFFSTFVITLLGEILPQAYFSRHALRMASLLSPFLRVYQVLLFPVAKPLASILDSWLGCEGIHYYREHHLREVIKRHVEAGESDIDRLEGIGALNFLAIDDLKVHQEGELLDPRSVLTLPFQDGIPVFPSFECDASDPFLSLVNSSGKKWVVLTSLDGEPQRVLDSDGFLRAALFREGRVSPLSFCHKPVIVKDATLPLGNAICQLLHSGVEDTDQIEKDIILVWEAHRRIITGSDILGRLLFGASPTVTLL